VLDAADLAVADHHVGVSGEDRADQARDVRPVVLVVGVCIDDHVRPQLQRGVDPRLEARRQALVVREPHEVVHAVRTRHRHGLVGRAVVDHQPLHRIEAIEDAREVCERLRELLRLVEAGNLDDELHGRRLPRLGSRQYPKAQAMVWKPSARRRR